MWGNAFLQQARSDWSTYNQLHKIQLDDCHRLYYLRITTEKLGKAALLKTGRYGIEDIKKHRLFVKYLRLSTRDPNLCKALGIKPGQLKSHINEILVIAEKIQNLAPGEGNDGANAEYPWLSSGTIFSPCNYKFPEIILLGNAHGRKFLRTIKTIIDNFESIY